VQVLRHAACTESCNCHPRTHTRRVNTVTCSIDTTGPAVHLLPLISWGARQKLLDACCRMAQARGTDTPQTCVGVCEQL
jgi:hypothetical protein